MRTRGLTVEPEDGLRKLVAETLIRLASKVNSGGKSILMKHVGPRDTFIPSSILKVEYWPIIEVSTNENAT